MRSSTISEKIRTQLAALPAKPGVYIMRNADGQVIYVGKAAKLKDRVRSYFGSPLGMAPKTFALRQHIDDFEYIVVSTVGEALLLEATLIKRHQPFFNMSSAYHGDMGCIVANVVVRNAIQPEFDVAFQGVVDTGASHLVLPQAWRARLGPLRTTRRVVVALANKDVIEGDVAGPIEIQIEGFDPVFSEALFVEMQPAASGAYEPLIGYTPLEHGRGRPASAPARARRRARPDVGHHARLTAMAPRATLA